MSDGKEETPVKEATPVEATKAESKPTIDVEALRADYEKKLQDAVAEKKRLEEGYKGLQNKYNKTYDELKKTSDFRTEIDTTKKSIKILAGQLAKIGAQSPEGMSPANQEQFLREFENLEKQEELAKKAAEEKAKQEEQFKHFDEIWAETQKFGTREDNDKVDEIWVNLAEGRPLSAERLLKKLQKEKTVAEPKAEVKKEETKEEKPKELSPEEKEKIFEEVAKAKGLLKTDTAVPSGRSASFEEATERFAKGEMSMNEYFKVRQAEGR